MTVALKATEQRTRLNVTTIESNHPRRNATLCIASLTAWLVVAASGVSFDLRFNDF